MSSPHDTKSYKVWALDDAVYGPVEMDSLVNWARDERILPESWVFCETTRKWLQALELTELRPIFGLEVPSFGSDSLIRPGRSVSWLLSRGVSRKTLRRAERDGWLKLGQRPRTIMGAPK